MVDPDAGACDVAVRGFHVADANAAVVFMVSDVCFEVSLLREAFATDGA